MQNCLQGKAERKDPESRLNLKGIPLGHKYTPEKGLMNLEMLEV